MARYRYKALDPKGTIVKGWIDATSKSEVFEKIRLQNLSIFEVKLDPIRKDLFALKKKTSSKDLSRYIRQLSTLLGAGLTLLEALDSLAKSKSQPELATASNAIRKDLRAGDRLSNIMERHIPRLPKYVARLAELGEETGQSAKALSDAAERMEFEETMRSEIRTALSYPAFLAVIGTVIIFLMFLFVVPRFEALIGDNGDKLPFISKAVINLGASMSENKVLVFIIFIALTSIGIYASKNLSLRQKMRRFLNHIPLIGTVFFKAELGGWARTVGIALDNGADLLSALKLGEYGLNSKTLKSRFERTRIEIRAGKNIDESLRDTIPEFDSLNVDLIRTGRASGNLANMLLFIGKTQEDETREVAKRIAAIAEPLAILFISLIVGTIVISIVLAMTSLYDFSV